MPVTPSTSPPDPTFVPRKEFIRDQSVTLNSFALLAISSSNCIRLYSFPPPILTTLRHLFEQRSLVIQIREDLTQNLCEFVLDGKPWANPKAVFTEKLLVDIMAVIYQAGYKYLSTIDYGRESDDRLAMAFSTPTSVQPGSRSATPIPPSNSSPLLDASRTSLHDKSRSKRVPFALSFVSATVMRVIAPPLHLTPAILQGVRGSWPRGVVSEKKVGENCYEFKLKGYKWFQQDNFATDSLHHILSLLASLDSHSFTLLTSISLTNRSRVKDLWIFTGPGPSSKEEPQLPDTPEYSVLDASLPDLKRRGQGAETMSYQHRGSPVPQSHHRRLATEPAALPSHALTGEHLRAVTDGPYRPNQHYNTAPPTPFSPTDGSPHVLRKPAPRAQVPVSVVQEDLHEPEGFRVQLPSTISSGAENMTGVGALGHTPDVFYTSSPYDAAGISGSSPPNGIPLNHVPIAVSPMPMSSPPLRLNATPLQPVSEHPKTPPLLASHSVSPPSSPRRTTPLSAEERLPGVSMDRNVIDSERQISSMPPPPLLGTSTFRDSAMSANSDMSTEIPIKWTGIGKEIIEQNFKPEQDKQSRTRSGNDIRASNTPMFPGGWQPTPIEEKTEEEGGAQHDVSGEHNDPAVHDVGSRVDSPQVIQADLPLRKSEAAFMGMIASTSPPPLPAIQSPPQRPQGQRKESQTSVSGGGGQGWVLVNVGEESNAPSPTTAYGGQGVGASSPEAYPGSPRVASPGDDKSQNKEPTVVSPAAKAIVVVDAMEAKNKKSRGGSGEGTPSGVRRFFSLSRKNSGKSLDGESRKKGSGAKSPARSGLRDRLRRIGTPEASRREDKRRSIE